VILIFIACYLAKYITKSRDLEYTYALATTDGLTELYNHRYFQEQMLQNVETGKRYNKPFSLIMIDIDFFKKINDKYGHGAGDFILKGVSDIFKRNLRKADIIARYGGEEIAVIIQETSLENILIIAEKIRASIENLNIEHKNSRFEKVTISIGVVYGEINPNQSLDSVVQLADEMLYKAKKNGKNRYELLEIKKCRKSLKEL
jgi:diguanylate cyclase (GGDEF)-like protein